MGCGSSSEDGSASKSAGYHGSDTYHKGKKGLKAEAASRDDRLAAYNGVKQKLPSDRSNASAEIRKSLFNKWDVNGNGKLSLAEIDKACREQLKLDKVTSNLEPILIRAYYATIDKHDEDGLIEISQFRSLLEFIAHFFELMFVFEYLGGNDDRRISRAEFLQNYATIKPYLGASGDLDAEAAFDEMDANQGGFVLFEELCDFAARKKLQFAAPTD